MPVVFEVKILIVFKEMLLINWNWLTKPNGLACELQLQGQQYQYKLCILLSDFTCG